MAQGDYGRAEGAQEEALHLARQVGARPEEAAALLAMGITQDEGHGRHTLGGRLLQEAYTLAGSLDPRFTARLALVPLARNARRRGQSGRARALVGRALDTAREGARRPAAGPGRGGPVRAGRPGPGRGGGGPGARPGPAGAGDTGGAGAPGAATPGLPGAGRGPAGPGATGGRRRGLPAGPPPGPGAGAGHLDGDALAGLARAALAQGAQDEALGHVAEIMERFALDHGADRPAGDAEPGHHLPGLLRDAPRRRRPGAGGRRHPRRPGTACSWSAPPSAPGGAAKLPGGRSRSAGPLAGLGGRPGRRPAVRPAAPAPRPGPPAGPSPPRRRCCWPADLPGARGRAHRSAARRRGSPVPGGRRRAEEDFPGPVVHRRAPARRGGPSAPGRRLGERRQGRPVGAQQDGVRDLPDQVGGDEPRPRPARSVRSWAAAGRRAGQGATRKATTRRVPGSITTWERCPTRPSVA